MSYEKKATLPFPVLSLLDSSVGTPGKGTLKRKQIYQQHTEHLFFLYVSIYIRLVYNLYVPYFCVHKDFYQYKQIVGTYLTGGTYLSVYT